MLFKAIKFNKQFQQIAEDSLRKGLESDIQTGYAKMGSNINISINTISNDILSGNISAIDGIQQFMKDNAKWFSRFPATSLPSLFDQAFNQFVQSEANWG